MTVTLRSRTVGLKKLWRYQMCNVLKSLPNNLNHIIYRRFNLP